MKRKFIIIFIIKLNLLRIDIDIFIAKGLYTL